MKGSEETDKLNLLIGVTGSVATIKLNILLELLSPLYNIKIITTQHASHFLKDEGELP